MRNLHRRSKRTFCMMLMLSLIGWFTLPADVWRQLVPLVSAQDPGVIITVTNTNDSGPGSLRDAILRSNLNPGMDKIRFEIPGFETPGSKPTIKPLSPLPPITDFVDIDGRNFQLLNNVVLDGSMAGANADGLLFDFDITQHLVVLRVFVAFVPANLDIKNFGGAGIKVLGLESPIADKTTIIQGGGGELSDNGDGIVLEGVDLAVIRDYNISGNTNGIVVRDSENVTIENCKIGTDAAGNADRGNINDGMRFENSSGVHIVNSLSSGNGGDGAEFNGGGNH